MSTIQQTLQEQLAKGLHELFSIEVSEIVLQETKKEFEGAYTLVVFPYTKQAGKAPAAIATDLGNYLLANCTLVKAFQVVQGFLNISIHDSAWLGLLSVVASDKNPFQIESKGEKILIEYSSPNTNKPLHLGHLRNNFLGFSVAKILAAGGYEVVKTNLVNDRGIHICKSMLAYQLFGKEEKKIHNVLILKFQDHV